MGDVFKYQSYQYLFINLKCYFCPLLQVYAAFDLCIIDKEVQSVEIWLLNSNARTETKVSMVKDRELKSVWRKQVPVSEKDFSKGHISYNYTVTISSNELRGELYTLKQLMNRDKWYPNKNTNIFRPIGSGKVFGYLTGLKDLLKDIIFPSIKEENCAALQDRLPEIFRSFADLCKMESAKMKPIKKDFFNFIRDLVNANEPNQYQKTLLLLCIHEFSFVAKVKHPKLTKYLDGKILLSLLQDLFLVKTDCHSSLYKDSLREGITYVLLAVRNFWDVLDVLAISYPALGVDDFIDHDVPWVSRKDSKTYFDNVKLLVQRAKNSGNIREHLHLFEKLITGSLNVSSALEAYTFISDSIFDSVQNVEVLNDAIVSYFESERKQCSQYSSASLLDIGCDIQKIEDPYVKRILLQHITKESWTKLESLSDVSENSFTQFFSQVDELLGIAFEDNKHFATKVLKTVSQAKHLSKYFVEVIVCRVICVLIEQLEPEIQNNLFSKWLENLFHFPQVSNGGSDRLQFLEKIFEETMLVAEKFDIDGITFRAISEAFKRIINSNKFKLKELLSIASSFRITNHFQYIYSESVLCALEENVLKDVSTLQLILDSSKSFDSKPETRQ